MPDIVLHDLDGLPFDTLCVPAFERPPRAVIYDGEVYVDLTRNKRDYYQVTVYDVSMPPEQPAEDRVAGAYVQGSGV